MSGSRSCRARCCRAASPAGHVRNDQPSYEQLVGLGRTRRVSSVMTPRVPSEPRARPRRSGPAALAGGWPTSSTPDGVARVRPVTSSSNRPTPVEFCPADRVAAYPPRVANSQLWGRWPKVRPSRESSSSSAGPRMPGPTVTRDDGTSSDRTDDIRPRSSATDGRSSGSTPASPPTTLVPPPNGTTTTPSSLQAREQGGGLLGGAGQHDGVRGVGGVARAPAEQVEVALAARPAQPRLPVGADVLLAEQLHEPGAGLLGQPGRRQRDVGDGDRRGRPGRPAQLLRQVAAGDLGHRAAQVVGLRWRCWGRRDPSPGSSVPAARARLQSAGATWDSLPRTPRRRPRGPRRGRGRRRRRGRRGDRRGGRAGRGQPRAVGGPAGARRPRRRDQPLVVEARARRPAVPGARRDRARAGERPRARRPHGVDGAAPGAAAAVPRARRGRPGRDGARRGRRTPRGRRPAVGARRPGIAAVDPSGRARTRSPG